MKVSDRELLQTYFTTSDEAAFTEIVRRHLPLVHAVALRVTCNVSLAEEASQMVFSRLVSQRRDTFERVPLVAWLHRSARSFSIDLVRAESSRRAREQAVASLAAMASEESTGIDWDRISFHLDDAVDSLSQDDRYLILSHYFQAQSFAEIAAGLGITTEAAKKRGQRALEKLRELLSQKGLPTASALLAAALSTRGTDATTRALPPLKIAQEATLAHLPVVIQTSALKKVMKLCLPAFICTAGGLLVVSYPDPGSSNHGAPDKAEAAVLQASSQPTNTSLAGGTMLRPAPSNLGPAHGAPASLTTSGVPDSPGLHAQRASEDDGLHSVSAPVREGHGRVPPGLPE